MRHCVNKYTSVPVGIADLDMCACLLLCFGKRFESDVEFDIESERNSLSRAPSA